MLSIVGFTPSGGANQSAIITLASDLADGAAAYEELRSTDAKNAALTKAAAEGLSSPGLSSPGTPAPYPVSAEGQIITGAEMDASGKRAHVKPSHWRIDYAVTKRLV